MSFIKLGRDVTENGYLMVDNIFMSKYLPNAEPLDVKVYLYGLFLANSSDDIDLQKMSLLLKLTEEKILSSFYYWEGRGLVSVSKSHPFKITYHSPKLPITPVVKYNASEYAIFIEELARLFPDKIIIQNEYEQFINLIRDYKLEINAMLMIIHYCLTIKPEAGIAYIVAVASDWASKGITSEKRVNEHIANLELNNEDIRQIFQALGVKSSPTLADRELYLRWTVELKLSLDAILTAARTLKKRGGMEKLDRVISEFVNKGAATAMDIAKIHDERNKNINLAKDIVKTLGVYYSSFDMVIETYLLDWKAKGFVDEALVLIAKYCFLRNVKTLDSMSVIVNRFCRLGLISPTAVNNYIKNQQVIDALITEVLETAGGSSFVSNRDREMYAVFADDWCFSHEVILLAAKISKDRPFPMSNISRLLSQLKENNITSLESAKKYFENPPIKIVSSAPKKAKSDYIKHDYTKEQLTPNFNSYLGDLFDED